MAYELTNPADLAAVRLALGVRKKIGIVIAPPSQSNERGNGELTSLGGVDQIATYPQGWKSQRNPSVTAYLPGVNTLATHTDERLYPYASPWMKVYDDLWDAGFDPRIAVCAIGSMSAFTDAVGYPRNRRTPNEDGANYFRQRRVAGTYGPTDPGCAGTLTVQNGYVFECTTGSEYLAVLRNEGAKLTNSSGDVLPNRLDYLYSPTASKKIAGTGAPNWASATTIGSTVTDGAVVWTNIGSSASLGYAQNTAFKPKTVDGPGFDPFGLVRRGIGFVQSLREQGCERIFALMCNGQSDAGATSQANYQLSLTYLTQAYRSAGAEAMIGLSSYTRSSATAGWDALVAARQATLAAFSSDPGVHAGADLYTVMGNVEGQNGLTYNTAGTTADNNAHLNAPGLIVAGGHHSAALLAALAK